MGFSLRLQKFCWCCSLRTGSLVIGTAGWILTLLELFAMIDQQQPEAKVENDDWSKVEDKKAQDIGFHIGYGVITLIACIALIWGIYKKDKRFMLPWLVLKCIEAVLIVLAAFIIFIIACVGTENTTPLVIAFFVVLFLAVSCWYFWLCVWSHYIQLGEHDHLPPVYFATTATGGSPPPVYEKGQQLP